jgi:hypothetical protein
LLPSFLSRRVSLYLAGEFDVADCHQRRICHIAVGPAQLDHIVDQVVHVGGPYLGVVEGLFCVCVFLRRDGVRGGNEKVYISLRGTHSSKRLHPAQHRPSLKSLY